MIGDKMIQMLRIVVGTLAGLFMIAGSAYAFEYHHTPALMASIIALAGVVVILFALSESEYEDNEEEDEKENENENENEE